MTSKQKKAEQQPSPSSGSLLVFTANPPLASLSLFLAVATMAFMLSMYISVNWDLFRPRSSS